MIVTVTLQENAPDLLPVPDRVYVVVWEGITVSKPFSSTRTAPGDIVREPSLVPFAEFHDRFVLSPGAMDVGSATIMQPLAGCGGKSHSPAKWGSEGHDAGTIERPEGDASANRSSEEMKDSFPPVLTPLERTLRRTSAKTSHKRERILAFTLA